MRKGIKRAVTCLLFTAILILGLFGIYNILSWKDTSGEYFSSFKQLETLPENTVEVLAIGSSRAYGSFNPAYYWKEAGIPTFTMGISGMARESAYYTLIDVLKTQSPKVVLVESSLLYTDEYLDIGNQYRNTVLMKPSKHNSELINKTVSKDERSDYNLRFPIIHNRFSEVKKEDFKQSLADRYALGYTFSYSVESQPPEYEALNSTEITEPDDETIAWIDRMKALSDSKNFVLVIYSAPQNIQLNHQKILNGCFEYLDSIGVSHLDLSREYEALGLDFDRDFSDAGHINRRGEEKVSPYMLTYLSENFSLPDHRGDPLYKRWDDNVIYDSQRCVDYELDVINNIDELLEKSLSSSNFVVAVRKDGKNSVYENGNLIYAGEGELITPVPGDEKEFIYANGEFVNIGPNMFISSSDEEAIVIYDTVTGYLLKR